MAELVEELSGFTKAGFLYRIGDDHFIVYEISGGWSACATDPKGVRFDVDIVAYADTRAACLKALAEVA